MLDVYLDEFKSQLNNLKDPIYAKELEHYVIEALKDKPDAHITIVPPAVFSWLHNNISQNSCLAIGGWQVLKLNLGWEIPSYILCGDG